MTFNGAEGTPPASHMPPYGSGYPASSVPNGIPQQPLPVYYPGTGYPVAQPTSTLAVVSLIFGIGGFVILPVIGSIVAIITGHMALSEMRMQPREGRGMAVAGLVLGYLGVAALALGILALMFFFGVFYVAVT